MNAHDHKRIERRLLRERDRTMQALRALQGHTRSQEGRERARWTRVGMMMCSAEESWERRTNTAIAAEKSRYLSRVEGALKLLFQSPGSFDVCALCAGNVPDERLRAPSQARYCLECWLGVARKEL